MTITSVSLTSADKKKIKKLLATGQYSTQSEILRAGLRRLRVSK